MTKPYRTLDTRDHDPFYYSRKRCARCKREFLARGGGSTGIRFCSDRCQRDDRNARLRAQYEKREPSRGKCVVCGGVLWQQRKTKLTCSNACRQAAYRARA